MLSAFYNTAFCMKINRFYFDFIYYFSEYCGYVNANTQQTPFKQDLSKRVLHFIIIIFFSVFNCYVQYMYSIYIFTYYVENIIYIFISMLICSKFSSLYRVLCFIVHFWYFFLLLMLCCCCCYLFIHFNKAIGSKKSKQKTTKNKHKIFLCCSTYLAFSMLRLKIKI